MKTIMRICPMNQAPPLSNTALSRRDIGCHHRSRAGMGSKLMTTFTSVKNALN